MKDETTKTYEPPGLSRRSFYWTLKRSSGINPEARNNVFRWFEFELDSLAIVSTDIVQSSSMKRFSTPREILMNRDQPFALHITWTTYGSRLPGDPRGHVSNTLDSSGSWSRRANVPGSPVNGFDADTLRMARSQQKGETVWLDYSLARIVAEELIEATSKRGWSIIRAAIISNHCHVLLKDCPEDGPAVRRILKGTTQAKLSDHLGKPQRWWTRGGSDRYKNDWDAIEAAISYIEKQDGILVEIRDHMIV